MLYLGGRGTFGMTGFGEPPHGYFKKDVSKLSLPEAATLAGLIQRPSYVNPLRHPDRALERRNVVLALMRDNRYITEVQYQEAIRAPVGLHPGISAMSETQYFLDIANDQLQRHISENTGEGAGDYTA